MSTGEKAGENGAPDAAFTATGLCKVYRTGETEVHALRGVDLTIPEGEVLVLLGGWVAMWAILSRFHPAQQFWHDAWAGTRLVHFDPGKK